MHSMAPSFSIAIEHIAPTFPEVRECWLFMPKEIEDRQESLRSVQLAYKSRLEAELIEMASPERKRDFLAKLLDFEKTVSVIASGSKEYANCKDVTQAIEQFFSKRQYSATQDEIVRALLEGGFMDGDEKMWKPRITAAINVLIRGFHKIRGKFPLRKTTSGQIGPESWPDSRFQA